MPSLAHQCWWAMQQVRACWLVVACPMGTLNTRVVVNVVSVQALLAASVQASAQASVGRVVRRPNVAQHATRANAVTRVTIGRHAVRTQPSGGQVARRRNGAQHAKRAIAVTSVMIGSHAMLMHTSHSLRAVLLSAVLSCLVWMVLFLAVILLVFSQISVKIKGLARLALPDTGFSRSLFGL